MLYKTIALELLESRPTLYRHLRLSRRLLSEMERYASDLRSLHLRQQDAGMDSHEAMEHAVHEIEVRIAQEAARLET
ncbi:hypothetical protein [Fimbriiglobus ruber]|uniref:Uncharacterized protein n=1 Tax=Fimbriiglobus ruber TaxID=1908690 RepID=A0A225E636_9BACT|nr:hypothetical protein [Fimbriiglobus ruber]OWK45566.1 hypothetical protein FRUB_01897 [Fimbriiglobus ruber]